MRFSLNLLKQFAKINVPPQKLGELLTEHAFEVEEVVPTGKTFDGIVAAKVVDVQKHPNADRLRVARLDVGNKIIGPVVCGAFNFEVGDMVALALPGAKIDQNIHNDNHESFILGAAVIRGVQSQGMICAAFELGLADQPGDKPEIMILDKQLKHGTPLAQALNLSGNDYVLNIALPANRPDVHSHLGLAREIAAVLNQKFKEINPALPKIQVSKNWQAKTDKTFCPKFYAVKLEGIKIEPSPKFIRETLEALGQRPINNVVDITNYIMIKYGQPTHAYDAAKVAGKMAVRPAEPGEKFSAINHKTYELTAGMYVVADEQKAIALGGMIGGLETEINQNTKEIIFEVANFNAQITRRTSKQLGFRTDGSSIWEKGVHPNLADIGLAEGLKLLQQYAGAKISGFTKVLPAIKKPLPIKFTAEQINKLLGTAIAKNAIARYLFRYGIKISGGKIMTATPPWWRTDITTMPDLAEEVLKLYGYNQVKPQALIVQPPSQTANGVYGTEDIYQAKAMFARLGYTEVQNYNFVSEKDILKFGGDPNDHVQIQNPLSEDQGYLKKYPLIPILKNISFNQKNSNQFKLFEVRKQYLGFENEPLILLAAFFSKQTGPEKLLMTVKADVLELSKSLGITTLDYQPDDKVPWLHLKIAGIGAGGIGVVDETKKKNFDVDGNVAFVKLELEKIFKLKKDILFAQISKFPSVDRDISIIIKDDITWGQIEKIIKPQSDLILNVSLFEAPFLTKNPSTLEYHKKLQNQGLKNYGIRLSLGSFDHTLTDTEITGIVDKIVLKLKSEIQAEIR